MIPTNENMKPETSKNTQHHEEQIKTQQGQTLMDLKDFILLIILRILLPTTDVTSDFSLFLSFLTGSFEPYSETNFIEKQGPEYFYSIDLRPLNGSKLGFGNFEDKAFSMEITSYNDTHYKLNYICTPNPQPKYALLIAFPLILHICLLLRHWWKIEDTIYKRLLTLPILIFPLWPQYLVLKLLYNKPDDWKKQKVDFEKNIHSLGISLLIISELLIIDRS